MRSNKLSLHELCPRLRNTIPSRGVFPRVAKARGMTMTSKAFLSREWFACGGKGD